MTRHGQDTNTTITARAMHHGEGVTLTIEIPAEGLPTDQAGRFGFAAELVRSAIIAMDAPQPGTLRMIRGGKA